MKIFILISVFLSVTSFLYFIFILIYRYRNISLLRGKQIDSLNTNLKNFFIYLKGYLLNFNKNFIKFKRYENISLLINRLNLNKQISCENFMIYEEAGFIIAFFVAYIIFENLLLGFILALAGFFAPEIILKSKVRRKDENILKELPDSIDIISANIEGGLSIIKAISKYLERNKNDFAEELKIVMNNINIGRSFSEALQDMNKKLNLNEVNGLVNVFIQADKFGGNVKEIIRAQSDEIRAKRFQILKKKAHEAPVKLLIPLIIFIFPVIFIVLFGPVIIKLMSGM